MIATRFMELRKRRGLMIALVVVNIGIPTIFLTIRLLAHAVAPKSYGPAGGYDIYTGLVAGVMYVFGFIVAATLGCTAGSVDLTEGMFRHLVVTGRSRLALYLARIPAGLAIVVPLVAVGFTIVCAVCVFAAPTTLELRRGERAGRPLAGRASRAGRRTMPDEVVCDFGYNGPSLPNVACGPNGQFIANPVDPERRERQVRGRNHPRCSPPRRRSEPPPSQIARQNYSDYASQFLSPSDSLMIESGLWLELEALIGFVVGLGLASLIGQRTVAVILMIVLEIILTPIFSRARIPHLLNLQRAVVGVATAHLAPGGMPVLGGGGGGPGGGTGTPSSCPESTTVAVCVIVAWLVVWTALGAWRMMTRDA